VRVGRSFFQPQTKTLIAGLLIQKSERAVVNMKTLRAAMNMVRKMILNKHQQGTTSQLQIHIEYKKSKPQLHSGSLSSSLRWSIY
jgi:hypothetical protein